MGQYYGPKFLEDYMMAFWDTKNWLMGSGWNERKQEVFDNLYNLPGFHNTFDRLLDTRDREYYLRRYGMDYSNVRDPRKIAVSGVISSSINFVSDNVKRLYH